MLKAAFHVARTGRCGPVLVDIPRDIQEAALDFSYPDEVDLPGWRPPTRGHARQIDEAARRSRRAEKPVLYVGGGTLNADACDGAARARRGRAAAGRHDADGEERLPGDARAVLRLARHARAEVVELGDEQVRPARRRSARASTTASPGKLSAFAPGATVVHLDIDAAEIGKLRRADVPVVGPLKQVARRARPSGCAHDGRSRAPDAVAAPARGVARRVPAPLRRTAAMLKPQRVLETLRDLTAGRDDVVWTTGVGQHQMWAMQYLLCDRPRSFITSGGLGTMGYGVPAAIGAKAARPDATVVCVDGDGCFQMTCQELATAVLEDLPIVIVIVNNGYLGMVQQWQDDVLRRAALARAPDPPGARLRAARARRTAPSASRSTDEDELEPRSRRRSPAAARRSSTPASTPHEQCFPMIPAGAAALDLLEYEEPTEAEVTAA